MQCIIVAARCLGTLWLTFSRNLLFAHLFQSSLSHSFFICISLRFHFLLSLWLLRRHHHYASMYSHLCRCVCVCVYVRKRSFDITFNSFFLFPVKAVCLNLSTSSLRALGECNVCSMCTVHATKKAHIKLLARMEDFQILFTISVTLLSLQ